MRAKVSSAIYSLLVSLAIVIGKDVQFSGGMRDGPDVNYIDWGAGSAVAALALAVLLYPAVTALLRLTARFRIPTAAARTPDNRVFLIMWGLIFVCWTPYLLTFYPAGIVGDGALTPGGSNDTGGPEQQPLGRSVYPDAAVLFVAGKFGQNGPSFRGIPVCTDPERCVCGGLRGGFL